MNLNLGLNISQQQKLVMTQQMQVSMKILEMSNLDLKDYVEKVVGENPVLEIEFENDKPKNEGENKYDYKEMIKSVQFDSYGNGSYEIDNEEAVSPFAFISTQKSLIDYLTEQIFDLNENDFNKSICEYIIGNLDSRGYLIDSDENIASVLKVSIEEVKYCIELVQMLEPTGICARNLKECLILQLEEKGIFDDNLYRIINEFIELMGKNKFTQIAKELKITVKEAQEYGDMIKTLDPKPTRGFYTGEETKYIVCDALIKESENGFEVVMKNEFIPKLTINNLFKDIIKDEKDDKAAKYVKEKLDNAMFLIKCIEQRKNTLYSVLQEILERQNGYFSKGEKYLKPMKLKEIADSIGVHESTVSRAIKDKYINSGRGVVRIRDFFTVGLNSNKNDEDVSAKNIKNLIKDLIEKEDKSKPISDQNITDTLNLKGTEISRRTVAKYREEIGISASSKRKRF